MDNQQEQVLDSSREQKHDVLQYTLAMRNTHSCHFY